MQAMHCCFGIGALVSPLFVRASQSMTSSFHGAFWAFSIILFASAVSFLFLPSPQPPQQPSQHDALSNSGFISTLRRMPRSALGLLFLVALLLGVYVGNEVSFGAYVLMYSHQRLAFDEVLPGAISPFPQCHFVTFRLQSSGQYLTALYWSLPARRSMFQTLTRAAGAALQPGAFWRFLCR
jgi:hypothetical protein